MPYNVDNFSAQIAKKGIASPNKFAVKFTRVPSIALGKDKHSDLNLMCESVALAGRSVQSLLDRQYGLNRFGLQRGLICLFDCRSVKTFIIQQFNHST